MTLLLYFLFYQLPSPVHPTGFSFYIFSGFFAIFILLSSNNNELVFDQTESATLTNFPLPEKYFFTSMMLSISSLIPITFIITLLFSVSLKFYLRLRLRFKSSKNIVWIHPRTIKMYSNLVYNLFVIDAYLTTELVGQ